MRAAPPPQRPGRACHRAGSLIEDASRPSAAASDVTSPCEELWAPAGLDPFPIYRESELGQDERFVDAFLKMFTYYDSVWKWAKEQAPMHLGTFKPGQMVSCDLGVFAPAFAGRHGVTQGEVEARIAQFWSELKLPVTPLKAEIEQITRTGVGRILDDVVFFVDSEAVPPLDFVIREYALSNFDLPVYFVELSFRLYLPPGLHHGVVLMSEKHSDRTYFISFLIEMSAFDTPAVESMARAVVSAGDYIAAILSAAASVGIAIL